MRISFEQFVDEKLNGEIHTGEHVMDDRCCILEAVSLYKGMEKNDNPSLIEFADLRKLNDYLLCEPNERAEILVPLATKIDGIFHNKKELKSWYGKLKSTITVDVIDDLDLSYDGYLSLLIHYLIKSHGEMGTVKLLMETDP